MLKHDYRDMVAGGLLAATGLFIVFYAMGHYPIGTIRRMGPGMFPIMTGGLLACFGVALIISGWIRSGSKVSIRIWSPLFVLSSVAAFALIVIPFGLIPAIIATVVVASMAELQFRPLGIALLAGVVSLLCWLIFKLGLGLATPAFSWPF